MLPDNFPLTRLLTVITVTALLTVNSGAGAQQTESALDCDYSDARSNFGWGWNPVTGTSCAPIDPDQVVDLFLPQQDSDAPGADAPSREAQIDIVRAEYCDYTGAPLHNGWGWNNVLLESCAPIVTNLNPPVIVSEFELSFLEFPLHLRVSTDSTLYFFNPAMQSLTARLLDGSVIWEVPVDNTSFLTDLQLTPNQDLLIASSFGGRLIAFNTDGTVLWQVDQPGVLNNDPDIEVGDTAVVAYYLPDENAGIDPFIVSYNFDGTVRWRYEIESGQAQRIQEFTLGSDGLVYILIDESELDSRGYLIVQQ